MRNKQYTIETRLNQSPWPITKADDAQFKNGVRIAADAIQRHFPHAQVVMFSDDFFEGHKEIAINATPRYGSALGDALLKLPFDAAYTLLAVLADKNVQLIVDPGVQQWIKLNCSCVANAVYSGKGPHTVIERFMEHTRRL